MKIEDVKTKHIKKLCELYACYFGGDEIKKYIRNKGGRLEGLLNELHKRGKTEILIVGSRYGSHAQIQFFLGPKKELNIFYDLRWYPTETQAQQYKKSIQDRNNFEQAIAVYLKKR